MFPHFSGATKVMERKEARWQEISITVNGFLTRSLVGSLSSHKRSISEC